jgi:hypothetical protein
MADGGQDGHSGISHISTGDTFTYSVDQDTNSDIPL